MGWTSASVLLLALAGCGRVGYERADATSDGSIDAQGVDGQIPDGQTDGPAPCDYAALLLSMGPRAYWRLGDSGAAAVDASGNGYDGVYVGGSKVTGALVGDSDLAIDLNGVDEVVDVSPAGPTDIINAVSAVTLMAWTRTTTIPSGGTTFLPNFVPVISIRGTDPMLARALIALVQNDEIWTLGRTDDATTMPQQLVTTSNVYPLDGAWHFVVSEVDFVGGRFRTWIDGMPGPGASAAFTFTMTQPSDASSADIGASPLYNSWFTGGIDEAAVFTRTVTDAEIAALYACGAT